MVAKGGLIFEGKCIFENSPLPSLEVMSTAEKGGTYFREDTVLYKLCIKVSIADPRISGLQLSGGSDYPDCLPTHSN